MTEHFPHTSHGTPTSTLIRNDSGKTLIAETIGIVDNFFLESKPEGQRSLRSEERKSCLDRFGLLDQSPDAWLNFAKSVTISEINKNAGPTKRYIVIFSSRHGEAYHNAAMRKYAANKEWMTVMKEQCGDDEYTWASFAPDPSLTEVGKKQAEYLGWRVRTQVQRGMPMPESFYSSIHERSLKTTELAFGESTTIKISERFREQMGYWPFHKRHLTSEIRRKHRNAVFEIDTPEGDVVHPDERETEDHLDRRVGSKLADICASDPSSFISITSHQGVFDSILRNVGHPAIEKIKTAGMAMFVIEVTGRPVDSVDSGNANPLMWKHPDECEVSFTTSSPITLPQPLLDDITSA